MPRRCTVCSHPEAEAINKALVAGEPYRSVANRYDSLSQAAVQRHQENHLPAALLKAREIEEVAEANRVKAELERTFERVNLLFDACDRWLRDPADPSRYDIGPRAEELMVTYTEAKPGVNGRSVQRKAPLAALLERIERADSSAGRTVTMVETKHADPRDLVLKTAARLQGQIELLAKLVGQLDERPVVNVLVSPEWLELRAVIVAALEPHPGARESVLRAIEGIGNGSAR